MADGVGRVYLVGAGPGDPGLLTRRGEALLRQADVVVYDRLVAPALLELCPASAERVFVGKGGGGPSMSQARINALLIEHGRSGRRVVRLKGGDPFVFGRGGEEALELRAAGIPFEVVPGISSALAGPAYAGIPVTHRGLASSVTIATGHEDPSKSETAIDWSALARGADTLVFLMGVEHLDTIAEQLLERGRSADEPAALIRWATTPQQELLTGNLGTIADQARERGLRPPAVLVVGRVVELARDLAWSERRPLNGRRVLVTRAREQASALSARLAELGAQPLEFPTIRIEPLADPRALDEALARLGSFDWVILTSANGVRASFERLAAAGRDARAFGPARVAAIGPATAASLNEHGIRADFVPTAFTSDAIVAELSPLIRPGQRLLLLRADIAPTGLADGLAERGANVENVVAYRTAPAADGRDEVRRRLAEGEIDVVTFTSSSTVRNLIDGLGGDRTLLARPLIACIGPVTAATACELGLRVDLIAPAHTVEGLVDALVGALGRIVEARGGDPVSVFPALRLRRLRRSETLRRMVRETTLAPSDFILPYFVTHGRGVRDEVSSMPGVFQLSIDELTHDVREAASLGIPAVLLFGLPAAKDELGSEAYAADGIVQRAIRSIKDVAPEVVVVGDVCLCEYTSHGHCGVVRDGEVLNDPTLELLGRMALAQAEAGAEIVAPSDMMDGRVGLLRRVLDDRGFDQTLVMAYSAKFASGFYGPFREAADSAPQFGDRRSYQMDPPNGREALREIETDIAEGADFVMVKPALAYLDLIRQARDRFGLPIAAYNVSGEYAMVKAAARNGWIDEERVALEILTGIKRAGADLIISYFAKDACRWLSQ